MKKNLRFTLRAQKASPKTMNATMNGKNDVQNLLKRKILEQFIEKDLNKIDNLPSKKVKKLKDK
jgi:hypothetical protein